MAVTVDWGTGTGASRTHGIFGIYNRFAGVISVVPAKIFKLKFRVKVTCLNDTSVTYTKDFDSIVDGGTYYATINPVQAMQLLYFGSEYTGLTEGTSERSYSGIQIEIGEVSSSSASLPPTFEGYDTDDTFYFYNGYETPPIPNCYREPNWYNTTPIKLPKVKSEIYLLPDDVELLSMPSFLNIYSEISGGTNLNELVTKFYDSSGGLLSTSTIDLRSRPNLTGVGYWNININSFSLHDGDTSYATVNCNWLSGEEPIDSELLTLYPIQCNPKNDNYRLRWINRYGGEEFENFQLKHDKTIKIQRGKKIQSSGINYAATTFDDIENINNPNLKEFGNTYFTEYKLRSDFLTQGQLDALAELYRNNSVIMLDGTNELPVIVQDTSYQVLDIKNKLQKVEVTVRLANLEPNQI